MKRELRAALWSYAPDNQVRRTLEQPLDWYWRRGHKYFLYEYERDLLSPGQELPPLHSFTEAKKVQRTTEHILPQSAGAPCWTRHFSEKLHAELVHTLGNLVLTLDNSSYSNKCFRQKRGSALKPGEQPQTCYSQGKLRQEQELAKFDDWTPETIRQRQSELASWAMRRWHIDPPTVAEAQAEAAKIEPESDEDDPDVIDTALQ